MKTSRPLWIVLAVLVLIGLWFTSTNNSLVQKDEGVKEKWSQVQSVYQRRADLIQNLVATVKGYAKHEKDTLVEVTEARAKVGTVNINDPQTLKNFEASQAQMTSALSRLMVVAEKYPELKANENFRDLQSQLEGTENRITVERQRFNEAAREYNVAIRRFPQSLVASFRGFTPKAYFEAAAGSETAPKVEF